MTNQSAHCFRITAQAVLVASFVASISTYSVKTFMNVVEDRIEMPALYPRYIESWKEFPARFEKFFEDRIAWKHLQVRRYARFKLDRLGVSPTARVWVGDDGWLFYNHEAETEHYFSLADPRLVERRQQWVRALPEWHKWLKDRGIRLQIVVPPNKQSVYAEYLPPLAKKQTGPTPLDILLNELRDADSSLPFLDLRNELIGAKGRRIYFQTDTHWNPYGLFYGYQATVRALGGQPIPFTAVRVGSVGEKDGDLPRQMGYWRLGSEQFDHLELNDRKATKVDMAENSHDETRLTYLDSALYVQRDSKLPRAMLFHDSFGDGMFGELLAQHYSQLLCIPSNHMDPEMISREKPDVVILEIVERLFQGIGARRPTDPPRRSLTR